MIPEGVPTGSRREDFPESSFLHLEREIICTLRTIWMRLAVERAKARDLSDDTFTVTLEDIDATASPALLKLKEKSNM